MGDRISQKWYEFTTGDLETDRYTAEFIDWWSKISIAVIEIIDWWLKVSFHFPQIFPLISDRSVWHNGTEHHLNIAKRRFFYPLVLETKEPQNCKQYKYARERNLRWFPHNIRAIMAKIKLPKNPLSMVLFWIKVRRSCCYVLTICWQSFLRLLTGVLGGLCLP